MAIRKAPFFFKEYKFTRSMIDFSLLPEDEELNIEFKPFGKYYPKTGEYYIYLNFRAISKKRDYCVISVDCEALFEFGEAMAFSELPDYFFTNSTAILYPYIRAYISTLSLQSNYDAFVLPTLNVSSLGEELKAHSEVIDG